MSNQNQPPAGGEAQGQQRNGRLQPFTVEFGDDNCRNPVINTPPIHCKVRGAFSKIRMASRKKHPRGDLGVRASQIPDLPGQRLLVDPAKKTARLFDPLEDGEGKASLDSYNSIAKATFGLTQYAPVPAVDYKLDDHQLKSLIIEMRRKAEHGTCQVVDGQIPSEREIEQLPGRVLNDPWNNGRKPKFKDEIEAWERANAIS